MTFLVCVGGVNDGYRVDVPEGHVSVRVVSPNRRRFLPMIAPTVPMSATMVPSHSTLYHVREFGGARFLAPSGLKVSDVAKLLVAGYLGQGEVRDAPR